MEQTISGIQKNGVQAVAKRESPELSDINEKQQKLLTCAQTGSETSKRLKEILLSQAMVPRLKLSPPILMTGKSPTYLKRLCFFISSWG